MDAEDTDLVKPFTFFFIIGLRRCRKTKVSLQRKSDHHPAFKNRFMLYTYRHPDGEADLLLKEEVLLHVDCSTWAAWVVGIKKAIRDFTSEPIFRQHQITRWCCTRTHSHILRFLHKDHQQHGIHAGSSRTRPPPVRTGPWWSAHTEVFKVKISWTFGVESRPGIPQQTFCFITCVVNGYDAYLGESFHRPHVTNWEALLKGYPPLFFIFGSKSARSSCRNYDTLAI